MTLEELKKLYAEKGATEQRVTPSEQGDIVDYIPVQLGEGWTAGEKDNRKIIDYIGSGMDATPVYDEAPKTLGGFAKQEGDYVYNYDPEGNYLGRTKWNENDLKTMWNDLGPVAMAALTMGGGAGALGNALFGLEGAAAAGAGGALGGGFNAAMNDQNILKGALLGGAGSAGALELGDTGFKLGDVTKAINFAQNPTLAGAANLASPYMPNFSAGDISLNDVLKNVGTAKALASGDERQIFNAIKGIAGNTGSLKSSLAGFDANPDDFTEGYFQPGGEGYNALVAGNTTVSEEPENIDSLLRALSPYATDGGTSIFKQPEDIPEMETVAKRPKSFADILGTPDILQTVEEDLPELTITGDREKDYVPGIRTKDIVSDIPDYITPDQIDKLTVGTNIDDILQTVIPGGTKTVTPGGTKTTTPAGTQTTKQALANLGLGGGMQQAASQDPYADIKLMEELFGQDIAYKLLSLGGNKGK